MKNLTDGIYKVLKDELPKNWDGKKCVQEMYDNGSRQWRQMEWIGFYFEYKCEQIFSRKSLLNIPGPSYGRVEFDSFNEIPWDFKTHSIESGSKVITNGLAEIRNAIADYGAVGFIIVNGNVIYDEDREFLNWHNSLKGEPTKYVEDRKKRGARSRMRKKEFIVSSVDFVVLDIVTVEYCEPFQKGMRNSDGTPRNSKIMVDLSDDRITKYSYKF